LHLHLYDTEIIIQIQNHHQAQLLHQHTLDGLNRLKAHFVRAIIEIVHTLLTVSLAFLVLNQIRNRPIKVTMVFACFKNWRSLLFISGFYLLQSVLYPGLFFLFKATHLYPLSTQDFSKPTFVLSYTLFTFLAIFLDTYFILVAFMASLLALDQKLMLKNSLRRAFKSINHHWFKNSVLLFLPNLMYMSAWSDPMNLFLIIRNGYALFSHLILWPGMFMAILFILNKKMSGQTNLSRMKNITLIILKVILGLVVLELFFSRMGWIWVLPMMAVLIAMQYQHIFSDKSLSYV
jgi:hypothetical protein